MSAGRRARVRVVVEALARSMGERGLFVRDGFGKSSAHAITEIVEAVATFAATEAQRSRRAHYACPDCGNAADDCECPEWVLKRTEEDAERALEGHLEVCADSLTGGTLRERLAAAERERDAARRESGQVMRETVLQLAEARAQLGAAQGQHCPSCRWHPELGTDSPCSGVAAPARLNHASAWVYWP